MSHFVRRVLAAFIAFEVDGSVEEYADSLRRLAAHLRGDGDNTQEPHHSHPTHSRRQVAESEGESATGVDRASKMLVVYEQLALLLQLHDAQLRP